MSSKANEFLKKNLGEDFFESLSKVELWKPGTRTTIDHEEIKTALQIVPRTLMAILIRELGPMKIGETKELHLPVPSVPAMMRVTKHERDVYSGDIEQDNKKLVDFKYRSLPGVGLVILSAFELYDVEEKHEAPKELHEDANIKIQKLIDDRLALHDLIGRVVDNKIQQKDAVNALILRKLTEELSKEKEVAKPVEVLSRSEAPAKKKGSPLKDFLNRKSPKEFSVHMAKGESVNCPDCDKNIFDGKLFSGCICLGDDMQRKVFIKKTEDGIKVRFSKGWDNDNIEMLLDVLRRKRG